MTLDLRTAALCAALALAPAAPPALAQAAAPAKPKPAAAAKPAGTGAPDRVLTPAQLKDCLDQQTRVEADAAGAEREREGIEGLKNELKASGASLDDALTTLDRGDPAAVDAYNARVKEREERIGAYEARVAAYNGRVDTIRGTREAFAKSCGNRRYDVRDLEDLNRSKKKS